MFEYKLTQLPLFLCFGRMIVICWEGRDLCAAQRINVSRSHWPIAFFEDHHNVRVWKASLLKFNYINATNLVADFGLKVVKQLVQLHLEHSSYKVWSLIRRLVLE